MVASVTVLKSLLYYRMMFPKMWDVAPLMVPRTLGMLMLSYGVHKRIWKNIV